MPCFFSVRQIEQYEEVYERLAIDGSVDEYTKSLEELLLIVKKANKKIKKFVDAKSERWLESEKGLSFVDTYEQEWLDQQYLIEQMLLNVNDIIKTKKVTGFPSGVLFQYWNREENFVFSSPDFDFIY